MPRNHATPTGPILTLGGLALLLVYALHIREHLAEGHPEQALWICNVATLIAALAALARSRAALSVAFLWALIGSLFWGADLIFSDAFRLTSWFTHLGSLALSFFAVSRLGMMRGAWWMAVLIFLAVQQLTRWLTNPADNINAAFDVYGDWDALFPNYAVYASLLFVFASALLFVAERLILRRYAEPRPA